MALRDLAKMLYVEETASKDAHVTVRSFITNERLWDGRVDELERWDQVGKWGVLEVLIDTSDRRFCPIYNKDKVLLVF